jgi:hypothetical protein
MKIDVDTEREYREALESLLNAEEGSPNELSSHNSQFRTPSSDKSRPKSMAQAARHRVVGEILEIIEPETEADPNALIVQLLVAFGSAVGRNPYFVVDGGCHHTNEFALIVGDTAKARKGTSWGYIRRILTGCDSTWSVRSGLASGEGLIYHVRDASWRPNRKGEMVLEDHGVEDKRLCIVESEFASPIAVMARPGSTLSPVLRDAWDGKYQLQTLAKNEPVIATEPHASVIGHITSVELQAKLDQTELVNGFANRFLVVAARRSKKLPEGGRVSDGQFQLLSATLGTILGFARSVGEMTRDQEATELWRTVYDNLSEGRPGLLGAAVSRAEAHVVRLSMIYALLDESSVIRRGHLEAALAVWDYCYRSAEYILGGRVGDRDADRILTALNEHGPMDRTAISDLFRRHKRAEELDQLRDLLVRLDLITVQTQETKGRAREVWRVSWR